MQSIVVAPCVVRSLAVSPHVYVYIARAHTHAYAHSNLRMNPADATKTFCEQFGTDVSYVGPYATFVARRLPRLPDGVNPKDDEVHEHVLRIVEAMRELSCIDTFAETEEALKNLKPRHQKAQELETAALSGVKSRELSCVGGWVDSWAFIRHITHTHTHTHTHAPTHTHTSFFF